MVSLVEGIDAGSIEFLINALNELIIAEDMAKKLKDGKYTCIFQKILGAILLGRFLTN